MLFLDEPTVGLDVVPREVVDSANGRKPSERGVGPVEVVPVQPVEKQAQTLLVA